MEKCDMNKKPSKKKVILIVLVCLVVILAAALVGVGNYLVSFAISRDFGSTNVAPESTLSEDALEDIRENWQVQKKPGR